MTKIFIGIDVSAQTLDICAKTQDGLTDFNIKNTTVQIKNFFKNYSSSTEEVIVAMENTGRYNWHLYEVLESLPFTVFVIHPLHIKRSLGMTRGKNDKIDAQRICRFIEKNYTELTPWEAPTESIKQLSILNTERTHKIKARARLLQQNKDYKLMKSSKMRTKLVKLNRKNITFLDKQILEIEVMIEDIILEDVQLSTQYEILQSIPGVGKVLSSAVIAKTQGFKKYNKPRKLACFAGVVPFDFQSGTSINYKSRVSKLSDKSLKTLLHMAAMSAIRVEGKFKKYYQRKVAEGKSKMSVLNAIRNKIIHVMYALIKNETFYNKDLEIT